MRGGGFQDRGEMRGGGQWTVIKAVGRRGWFGRGTYCALRWKDGLSGWHTYLAIHCSALGFCLAITSTIYTLSNLGNLSGVVPW